MPGMFFFMTGTDHATLPELFRLGYWNPVQMNIDLFVTHFCAAMLCQYWWLALVSFATISGF